MNGESASTKYIHCPLLSYTKRWVLNYNDNRYANWNMQLRLTLNFLLLINKQFSGNGWGWNNIFAGTGGDGMDVLPAGMGGDGTETGWDGRGWI